MKRLARRTFNLKDGGSRLASAVVLLHVVSLHRRHNAGGGGGGVVTLRWSSISSSGE